MLETRQEMEKNEETSMYDHAQQQGLCSSLAQPLCTAPKCAGSDPDPPVLTQTGL